MDHFDRRKTRGGLANLPSLIAILAVLTSASFAQTIRVDSTPSHVVKTFVPTEALGDGTDANGYSRITDGDENTYWKSNPYLSKAYTGEDDSNYPQWVVMDLAGNHEVDAIRISWGEPYARRYLVQYWAGEDPIKQPTAGAWVTFQGGEVTSGNGGKATLRLASAPMLVRYLRVWMTQSSNTCDDHGSAH